MQIPKCVKQHSFELDPEVLEELEIISDRYNSVKNYIYSRYSGIKSLLLIQNARKNIRDIWTKDNFAEQWKLPARYWKMALEEAVANIKTEWSNIKLKTKRAVYQNENLTEDERYFILYVLKADKLLYAILNRESFDEPKKLMELEIREKYIFNLICRYIRKYKGDVPYTKSRTFSLDADMYNYKTEDGVLYINIMGLKRRNRLKVKLRDHNIHKGNVKIVLRDNSLEVHKLKYVKQKKATNKEKVVGIDKGYRTLINTSEGNQYGEKLNEMLSEETERLNKINKERNKFYALYRRYKEQGKTKKAEDILQNNLGKKKYNKKKKQHDNKVKSYINCELNKFIDKEKPSEIVMEDLTFVSWKNIFPKHIKRKLSRWIKGYIHERLNYKADLIGAMTTIVNPAYTSKVCSGCGKFGNREGDLFKCECGEYHADINAAINIKKRKFDSEIGLYTPYKQVEKILEKRIKEVV